MNKFVIASAALAITTLAAQAHAQAYAELGLVTFDASAVAADEAYKSEPVGVRGMFGYDVDPFMSVEAMAIFGADGARIKGGDFFGTRAESKIGNSFGVYIKPKYRLSNSTDVFARIGFARIKGSSTSQTNTFIDSENGLSYGAGLGFKVRRAMSVNFDYMQYLNKDEIQVNGFTVGLGYKF